MKIKLEEILKIIKGDWNGAKTNSFNNFAIDSRVIKENGLFFAIKGVRTDGHLFIKDAINNGAKGAIVEKSVSLKNKKLFLLRTASAKESLFRLGTYARENLQGSVIGITGSAGKTTTKEMLAHVLKHFFSVSKTYGNANTEFSLPLFFLNYAKRKDAFYIAEMGVQKKGDMNLLNNITNPDIAILLNAGASHLKFLGTVKDVAKEKFKLAEFVDKKGGTVILNGDDKNFKSLTKILSNKPILFGLNSENMILARAGVLDIDSMNLDICIDKVKFSVSFPFSGLNFVYDILAVLSLSYALNLPTKEVLNCLSTFTPVVGRGSGTRLTGDRLLIDETYNSNPLSLEYSLSRFRNHKQQLFVILGDMFELGDTAEKEHRSVGKILAGFMPDFVLTTGEYSKFIVEEVWKNGIKNAFYFPHRSDLMDFLREKFNIPENSVIFVKGSRGMQMEEAIKILKEKYKND